MGKKLLGVLFGHRAFVMRKAPTKIAEIAQSNWDSAITRAQSGRRNPKNVRRVLEDRKIVRHALLVLVGEVTVNLADQNAPVRVAKPFRNRHEVDAGHDALTGEEMPEVVKAHAGHTGFCCERA